MAIVNLADCRLAAGRLHGQLVQHRTAGLAFGIRIVAAGLAYATLILVARETDARGYAEFALILAATGFFGPAGLAGQETVLLKRLPIAGRDGRAGFRATIAESTRLFAPALLLFALLAAGYVKWSLGGSAVGLAALLAGLVLLNGTLEIAASAQRGSGALLPAILARELLWRVILVGVLLLHGLGGWPRTGAALPGMAYAVGLAASLGLLAATLLPRWRRAEPAAPGPRTESWSSTGSLWGISLLNHAVPQIDVLLLGLVSGASPEFAAYFSAQRLIQVLYFFQYGLVMTSMAQVPALHALNDREGLRRLSRQAIQLAGLCVIPAAILLTVFAGPILAMFHILLPRSWALVGLLALGPVIATMGGLHATFPTMCGLHAVYFRWRLAITLGFILLKIAALLYGDILLFAVTSVLDVAAVTLVGAWLSRRRLGIRVF